MEQYELLEKAILNCFITSPELIKKTKLSEKHFKKHRRLFIFLKDFYERFGKFDISLMGSVCTNPAEALDYIAEIVDTTSISANFSLYEERLLKLYNNFNEIEEINKLNKKLYLREIDLNDFKIELKEIIGEI